MVSATGPAANVAYWRGCPAPRGRATIAGRTERCHDRPAASEIHHQGLHVRPVRHRGGHAVRAGGGRHAVPEVEELAGQPECLRHLVAPHAFRELDDRRLARPRAHVLSRDRRARRGLRDGSRRHRPHRRGGARPGRRHRTAAAVSRSPRRARPACAPATSWWCCRTAIPTCWRRRGNTTASPSTRSFPLPSPGAFKPHHATYEKAAELAGVRREEVLFVANHAFDCIGAKATGMRTAFIDRRRRPFGATPAPTRPDRAEHDGTGGTDGMRVRILLPPRRVAPRSGSTRLGCPANQPGAPRMSDPHQ